MAAPFDPTASAVTLAIVSQRRLERRCAYEQKTSVWPREDLTSSSVARRSSSLDEANRVNSFGAEAELLLARYQEAKDSMLSKDRICDLAEEMYAIDPLILPRVVVDALLLGYHNSLDACIMARRKLVRPILAQWAYDPSIPSFQAETFDAVLEMGDLSKVLLQRSISAAGFVQDKIFLCEREPHDHGSLARQLYFCEWSDEKGKFLFKSESANLGDIDPARQWRKYGKTVFFFSAPLNKPASAPSLKRKYAATQQIFLYSGHQSAFFWAGLAPMARQELLGCQVSLGDGAEGERARKLVHRTEGIEECCPICMERDQYLVIFRFCGHPVACASCFKDVLLDISFRRTLPGQRCSSCKALFPAETPSMALDLEQARVSHCLDRSRVLRTHARQDCAKSTLLLVASGELSVPTPEEVHDLDVADAKEELASIYGLSLEQFAGLDAEEYGELLWLAAGLGQSCPAGWSMVESYLGFDTPSEFFRVDYWDPAKKGLMCLAR
jgi:hypothetical protein